MMQSCKGDRKFEFCCNHVMFNIHILVIYTLQAQLSALSAN